MAAGRKRRNTGFGWKMALFLPGFSIYLLIIIFPILMCLYFGFFNWDGLQNSMTFIGLDNFARSLTGSVLPGCAANHLLLHHPGHAHRERPWNPPGRPGQQEERGLQFLPVRVFLPHADQRRGHRLHMEIHPQLLGNPEYPSRRSALGDPLTSWAA